VFIKCFLSVFVTTELGHIYDQLNGDALRDSLQTYVEVNKGSQQSVAIVDVEKIMLVRGICVHNMFDRCIPESLAGNRPTG
jgi:hypothetical protein